MKKILANFVAGCLLFAGGSTAVAQVTSFTYQGQLTASGQTVNGFYDLVFSLLDTNGTTVGGPLTNAAVPVTNGFFTISLDFGTAAFTGTNIWMEISVSTNGANSFMTLSPPQSVTAAPWALTANSLNGTLPSSSLGGAYNSAVMLTNPSNSFAGDGSGLSNLNASALTAGVISAARIGGLTNHADVLAANLSAGDVLAYNGSNWTNGPIIFPSNGSGLTNLNASALVMGTIATLQMGSFTNHTDVLVSNLTTGDVLKFNGAAWANGPIIFPANGGGLTNLNASALATGIVPAAEMGSFTNHFDVVTTNLVAGNVLIYSGSTWTNGPQASTGGGGLATSNGIPVSLAYSGTNVFVDASLGTHFRLTITNNFLLVNPTNASDAQRMVFEFVQDVTGGHTMSLGNAFKLGTDLPFVNLTTNANLRDFMTCVASGTNFYVVGFVKGY